MTIVIILEQRLVNGGLVTINNTQTQLPPGDPNPYPSEALILSENPRNDRVVLLYVKPNNSRYRYVYIDGKRSSLEYHAYEDTSEIDALLAEMRGE